MSYRDKAFRLIDDARESYSWEQRQAYLLAGILEIAGDIADQLEQINRELKHEENHDGSAR